MHFHFTRSFSTFGGPFAFRPCDGFATMHGDMLMFRARHHGHFPPLTSHGRSSYAAINKHTAHTRLHTRFGTSHNQLSFNALSALSRPLRCLTRTRSQLKIQEPRTMDTTRWFASSVTSSRSCHVANISPLQLKAGLSLHCVTNRGLPFLFETVATKTAQHKGRWMINHFVKR